MENLISGKTASYIDEKSQEVYKIPAICLMEEAGLKAWQFIKTKIDISEPIVIIAGSGNNGGDALVIAREAINDGINDVKDQVNGKYEPVPTAAQTMRDAGVGTIIIGDENYGEGSSREQAAMEPRFLGVKVVIVRSFARIHETNLKKQGVLALTFADKADYNKVQEDDGFDVIGLTDFAPGKQLKVVLHHADGTTDEFMANHTYNENQIEWFRAGSALNLIKSQNA